LETLNESKHLMQKTLWPIFIVRSYFKIVLTNVLKR